MEILFEDNHLLALNKPTGLLTQPSGTDQPSLEALAKRWIKERDNKPGNVFLEAVHRLDRPVSGIVLFAKTSKALSRLQKASREGKFQKTYLALMDGKLPEPSGMLDNYLLHQHKKAKIVSKDTQGSKKASLHYQFNAEGQVEIHLKTGRYHQIRAQFSYIGCPILGDVKYGCTIPYEKGAIALHHFKLVLFHPISCEQIEIRSLPKFNKPLTLF